ncbi:syntaxin-18-like isoform X1 [Planococcus citri]|uniref:syntaxin-18-like isoform X1 n=1 Tax=Planococcus citri TaxID=170843 RepID=UPI0031FA12C1
MDITDIFRAYVKNEKLRRSLTRSDKGTPPLKFKNKRDEFNSKSLDVVYHITKLRDYLLEHKTQYCNINASSSIGPSMTDIEREKVDAAARNIIKNCSTLLKDLAVFIKANPNPAQLYEHRKGVLDVVENYLKSVCKMYSDLKEVYAERQSAYNSMMKVKSPQSSNNKISDPVNREEKSRPSSYKSGVNEDSYNTYPHSFIEELTEEELQMFEVENEDLINELNSLKGEVKAIEKKVTHIAGLQGTFTEMVMNQDLDIQRIDTTLVGATENVQDANLELRKAVQNNASFRVYLLFFIMMLSFTLLFLNWYND